MDIFSTEKCKVTFGLKYCIFPSLLFVCWVDALRPWSTAEVMSGLSVIHTVPGQASLRQVTST